VAVINAEKNLKDKKYIVIKNGRMEEKEKINVEKRSKAKINFKGET
jgi:hypothetical protein